jgi:hypothetical protein
MRNMNGTKQIFHQKNSSIISQIAGSKRPNTSMGINKRESSVPNGLLGASVQGTFGKAIDKVATDMKRRMTVFTGGPKPHHSKHHDHCGKTKSPVRPSTSLGLSSKTTIMHGK